MTCTRDSCTDESVSTVGDCKIGLRLMVSGSGSEPYMLSTSNDWVSNEGLEMGSESMVGERQAVWPDRKSTRLNSSHPLKSRMPSSA